MSIGGGIVELAARIVALHAGDRATLVAIDGLGGSGKSSLAAGLAMEVQTRSGHAVSIVHGDDFYLPTVRRSAAPPTTKPVGADFDWHRLRTQVLEPLRSGRDALYQVYDWQRDALTTWQRVPHGAIVAVEGVYTLRPELRALYDLRVWVDCPRDLRLARGLARDGECARSRWEGDWMPSEDHYVSECRPMACADVVISGASV